ncbi:MAG: hypothetical protein E7324_08135 [Clostridiales bacterium]|nr:hypothetical protein [Clostridiales bacterium]
MPQKQKPRKGKNSPYLFIALTVVLLIALLLVGVRALNSWNEYDALAAVTPVPTATVSPVLVTAPPNFTTYTPVPSPTPSYLSVGSKGAMVEEMQRKLQELGYYTGVIDGDYGSGTRSAVEIFQRQHGLSADGIAGSQTLSVLYSDRAKHILKNDTIPAGAPLLVNREHPVDDGFVPDDLVRVKDIAGDAFDVYSDSSIQGVREAVEALTRMINDARAAGYKPWKLAEGYRTLKYQQRIFDNQVEEFMSERNLSRSQAISATRQTVADAGQSEHHTGLAFDLNVPGEFFGDTAQYLWILENCWDYGFILRYTDEKQDITGFMGEEWHVRYVGVEHSKKMQQMGYCLEEYIDYLNRQ